MQEGRNSSLVALERICKKNRFFGGITKSIRNCVDRDLVVLHEIDTIDFFLKKYCF